MRRNQSVAIRTQPIRTQLRRRRREPTPTFEIGGGLTAQQCDSILPNLEVNQQMLQNDERCVVCQIGFTLGSLNAGNFLANNFSKLFFKKQINSDIFILNFRKCKCLIICLLIIRKAFSFYLFLNFKLLK